MPAPLPDLSDPPWTPALAALLEQAALAIGRLDARISASPLADTWRQRATWTGYAKALQGQGAEIEEIDIFGRECGAPLPHRVPLATSTYDREELSGWLAGTPKPAPHWREIVRYPQDLPADWSERPALLRALQLIASHARQEAGIMPALDLPIVLAALKITRTPLPCLVTPDKAWRYCPRDRDAMIRRYLRGLARASEIGLERLRHLEDQRVRAAHAIGRATRPGRLSELLAWSLKFPVLSPRNVSNHLGLSISGAGKLLTRAEAAGLLVEISGRRAWKVYVTADMAIGFGLIDRPRGRPPSPLRTATPLNETLSRFDAEMKAIDQRLAQLGVHRSNADEM